MKAPTIRISYAEAQHGMQVVDGKLYGFELTRRVGELPEGVKAIWDVVPTSYGGGSDHE